MHITNASQTMHCIFALAKRFTRGRQSTTLETRRKNMRLIQLHVHKHESLDVRHAQAWKGNMEQLFVLTVLLLLVQESNGENES